MDLNRNVVISQLCGGFGNQLFQYAAARAIATRNNALLLLDCEWFVGEQRGALFENFKRSMVMTKLKITGTIKGEPATTSKGGAFGKRIFSWLQDRSLWRSGTITDLREVSLLFDPRLLQVTGSVRLSGYWQSERYFCEIRESLLSEFTPEDESVRRHAVEFVCQRRRLGDRIVGVHVRRGDIAFSHETLRNPAAVGMELLPVSYYETAMKTFQGNVHFLICTDDPTWCQMHVARGISNREVVSTGEALQDFEIMRACEDNIIANSSFSWWAAWLNETSDKRIVCPSRWFSDTFPLPYSLDDLLPVSWQRINWD